METIFSLYCIVLNLDLNEMKGKKRKVENQISNSIDDLRRWHNGDIVMVGGVGARRMMTNIGDDG